MSGLVDLHRHLDGSLRPATVADLARGLGLDVPPDLAFTANMGLGPALERFAFTVSLLQTPAAVRRVAAEICEDAAADGVTALEIRFAPHLHRDASPAAIVDAALDGIDGRAGLILCGLYGDDPALLDACVDIAADRPGVVALDLAGGPASSQQWRLTDYERPFLRAAEVGLGRTVHASEGRPPYEMRIAIEVLGAQRIGHGTTLLDDPAVVDLVRDRGVTIEACPTSNLHTGVIPSIAAHPLARWLDAGVAACVNTDNTFFSGVDASEEWRRAASIEGMDAGRIAAALAFGHAAAFRRR